MMKPSEQDVERAIAHVSRTWPAGFDCVGFQRAVSHHARQFAKERAELLETLRWAGVLPRLPAVPVERPPMAWRQFRRRSG